MATSKKVTDHFLTCTVCTEVFNDPSTLQCYHTFCRKCVVTFTKTQPDAIAAKSLPCPFCRKWTKSTNPERPVEEWAKHLKPSFLIQGLIDSFGPGTKDTAYCSYCKEEGETTPATAWCANCDDSLCDRCARMHKRIPSSRQHDIIGLSDEVNVKRKRKVMCKEHKEEKIDFLCKDCKKVVCQKCCIIYHRRCESVVTVESEMASMKSALARNRATLMKKHEDSMIHADKKKSQVAEVTNKCSQIESQIRSESQIAKDLIDQKEKKLLDELKEIKDKGIGQLKSEIKTTEIAIQMYLQQSELIDEAVKSDSEMNIYEMYQSCHSGSESGTDPDLTDQGPIDKITFRKDTDKLTRVVNNVKLGEIEIMYEKRMNLKGTLVLQNTIHVGVTGDKNQADPNDVTVLDVNGIDTVVVTDFDNRSVKSFYNRNNQPCHSKLSLNSNPWSLTQLTQNQVAVTVPHTKQIVTVEVKPELKHISTITTEKDYWGITTLTPSTMAVSSHSPPSVDILNLTGTVIKSISSHTNRLNKGVFKYTSFLCTTSKGNILVSDCATKSVVCLTPQGDVVFTYSPTGDTALKTPRGMTVTNTGDILVADWNLQSVLHLTESGQFVRNILTSQDGLSNPRCLCIDKRGQLYVSLYNKGVKVFKNPS